MEVITISGPPSSTPSHHLLSSIMSQLTCSSMGLACQLVKCLRDQLLLYVTCPIPTVSNLSHQTFSAVFTYH